MRTLAELRKRIDAIDEKLLKLIDERATIAQDIALAKANASDQDQNLSPLRPDREISLLRRLLSLPRKAASNMVVERIWRELFSESLRIQTQNQGGLCLNFLQNDTDLSLMLLASQRFGAAPMTDFHSTYSDIIHLCRDARHIGVFGLNQGQGPWWARLLAQPDIRIFAKLTPGDMRLPLPLKLGLAIAKIRPQPTGNDVTYFVCDSPNDGSQLIEILSQKGFACEVMAATKGLTLIEIIGFVQEDDPRLSGFGSLSGVIGSAAIL